MNPTRPRHPLAFTMIEAVISLLIVSVMLAASLQVAAFSGIAQFKASERATGRFLAAALADESMAKAFEAPAPAGSLVLGRDTGEKASPRSPWDDVDDYNGLSETPPLDQDGNPYTGLSGWHQSVVVEWVTAADFTVTSLTDTGVKRITISITHNNLKIASRVLIRTRAP